MINRASEALELSQHIGRFLSEYVPTHLTNSENTLKSYETAIALYIAFLEEECGVRPTDFSQDCFDQPHLESWLSWLTNKRGCSAGTCNVRLSVLRAFARYLSSRNAKYIAVKTAADNVPYRKCTKKKVRGLSREAVKAILAAPDATTKTGLRDQTLMILLYGTAARIDELLSVRIKDLRLNCAKPYLIITGKGKKVRSLYLLPKAVGFLNAYLDRFHGKSPDKESYLFYSSLYGTSVKLSQQAVFKFLRKYAEAARAICEDVPLDLHAHQFRHAKASHWLEDGMNIVQISFLLGHASVETTMVYLDITSEQQMRALATLEDERIQNVSAKWNPQTDSLASLCGVRSVKA